MYARYFRARRLFFRMRSAIDGTPVVTYTIACIHTHTSARVPLRDLSPFSRRYSQWSYFALVVFFFFFNFFLESFRVAPSRPVLAAAAATVVWRTWRTARAPLSGFHSVVPPRRRTTTPRCSNPPKHRKISDRRLKWPNFIFTRPPVWRYVPG